jgi:hypothetical protein
MFFKIYHHSLNLLPKVITDIIISPNVNAIEINVTTISYILCYFCYY